MLVNLEKTKAIVINCRGQSSRREHIETQLSRVGIRFSWVDGVICKPGFIGCGLSHIKALSTAEAVPPIMVFEDDCTVTDAYQSILTIPDEADVLFLGVSCYGSLPKVSPVGVVNGTIATEYNSDFLRVHNMLSAHAVLYLSERMIEATRAIATQCILHETPFDIGLASLQSQFLALAPKHPFFYQDRRYGGMEGATKPPLSVTKGTVRLQVERNGPHVIAKRVPAELGEQLTNSAAAST